MCAVSMIGDHYHDKWKPEPWYPNPPTYYPTVSDPNIEKLRQEVLEMKELLKRAKKYDEDNNEPACEIERKVGLLRKVAEAMGVNISDVLKKPNK